VVKRCYKTCVNLTSCFMIFLNVLMFLIILSECESMGFSIRAVIMSSANEGSRKGITRNEFLYCLTIVKKTAILLCTLHTYFQYNHKHSVLYLSICWGGLKYVEKMCSIAAKMRFFSFFVAAYLSIDSNIQERLLCLPCCNLETLSCRSEPHT
jgi:hypothetical protein